jgi:uncharacterized protein (TIGR03435 family)
MSDLAGRPVIDKTGLDAQFYCTPDGLDALTAVMFLIGPTGGGRGGNPQDRSAIPSADSAGPSVFTAVEEKWGLKLDAQKAPVDVLVIDHVDRPSEN